MFIHYGLLSTAPSSGWHHTHQAAAKQGARDVAEALMAWYVELHDSAVVDAGVREGGGTGEGGGGGNHADKEKR